MTTELRTLCTEWQDLLRTKNAQTAHPLLRRLLPDRLTITRTPEGVRITGMATVGPLVAEVVLRGGGVPPGDPERLCIPWVSRLRAA